ncbi:MAG: hypothetical protein GF353_28135, partial [Candidatus Lokiarchaeota archaeon]|nr:hypothetical protein [Candidatus Lokiarchaeota archaeon]
MHTSEKKVLLLPTRYFPSISGAEFYFQRIAEILNASRKDNYMLNVVTSNAIDFRALRNPKGKTINKEDKFFRKVNNVSVKRFSVSYNFSLPEKLELIGKLQQKVDLNRKVQFSSTTLKKFLKNGPFSEDLINYLFFNKVINYDVIHTTYFPYFNLIITLLLGKYLNKPAICTPFFHFSNPRYLDVDLLKTLKKFDVLIACTCAEKRKLIELLR